MRAVVLEASGAALVHTHGGPVRVRAHDVKNAARLEDHTPFLFERSREREDLCIAAS
jgi:hypothetical protein